MHNTNTMQFLHLTYTGFCIAYYPKHELAFTATFEALFHLVDPHTSYRELGLLSLDLFVMLFITTNLVANLLGIAHEICFLCKTIFTDQLQCFRMCHEEIILVSLLIITSGSEPHVELDVLYTAPDNVLELEPPSCPEVACQTCALILNGIGNINTTDEVNDPLDNPSTTLVRSPKNVDTMLELNDKILKLSDRILNLNGEMLNQDGKLSNQIGKLGQLRQLFSEIDGRTFRPIPRKTVEPIFVNAAELHATRWKDEYTAPLIESLQAKYPDQNWSHGFLEDATKVDLFWRDVEGVYKRYLAAFELSNALVPGDSMETDDQPAITEFLTRKYPGIDMDDMELRWKTLGADMKLVYMSHVNETHGDEEA